MINLLCGLIGVTILSLFIGGLAFSIWDNTGSIAFPVIVVSVLIMAFVDFGESLFSGRKNQNRD